MKRFLLVLVMFLSAVGIVAVILLAVLMASREYEKKEDEQREEYFRQEAASREEEKRLEEEERRREEERLAAEAATATESPEEIERRYWEEEWENPIATASDAEFKYTYHQFKYTDDTIELKPYEEVYEEVKADMLARGEEIRTEETTSEDGEVIEPNLTIYNPLRTRIMPQRLL